MLDHERLDAYRASVEFAAIAEELVRRFPRGRADLGDQLRRAAFSIPLNIAEGTGKDTRPERARFYAIARGSALESAAILDVLRIVNRADPAPIDAGKALLFRIVAMLTKLTR